MNRQINVRLNLDELAQLRRYAAALDVSATTLARAIIVERLSVARRNGVFRIRVPRIEVKEEAVES